MANIEKEGRERTRNKGEAVGKEVRGEKKNHGMNHRAL